MNPDNIRYMRLKNSDEVIAYVEESEASYICNRPVLLFVINMYEDGKQLLNFREYLPPTIVEDQIINLSKDEIVYISKVKDSFKEEYIEMSNFFFETEIKTKLKSHGEETGSKKDKIVSIVDALLDKKGKPVH